MFFFFFARQGSRDSNRGGAGVGGFFGGRGGGRRVAALKPFDLVCQFSKRSNLIPSFCCRGLSGYVLFGAFGFGLSPGAVHGVDRAKFALVL